METDMRQIDFLVVHCSATPQTTTVESIERYWKNNLKWASKGYHVLIDASGVAHRLAPDSAVCNGVAGHNATSLHVSYIGGATKDNRTMGQKSTLINVLREWRALYPNAKICGHRDFGAKKACPQFDAIKEYDYI
jgi:N-acetylmuramoyl-L-alanine amidase